MNDKDTPCIVEVVSPEPNTSIQKRPTQSVSPKIRARDRAIEKFHGSKSLNDKMGGVENADRAMMILIQEMIGETDSLLGNRELAQSDGNIRDASVISSKRSEALERVYKALLNKREFEKESGIDVDSPSVRIIYNHFMKKAYEAFNNSGLGKDISDLFFRQLALSLENWKSELKKEFADVSASRGNE